MQALIRSVRPDDEPFLWRMLYYAAHMSEDGEGNVDAAKQNPDLQKYVQEWGRETDVGVLALHPLTHDPLGAAWMRVLVEEKKMSPLIPEGIPELAIALLPDYIGQGIGTQLLQHVLEAARKVHPAVMLSVRQNNPARHLYERVGFKVIDTAVNRVGSESFVMLIQFD